MFQQKVRVGRDKYTVDVYKKDEIDVEPNDIVGYVKTFNLKAKDDMADLQSINGINFTCPVYTKKQGKLVGYYTTYNGCVVGICKSAKPWIAIIIPVVIAIISAYIISAHVVPRQLANTVSQEDIQGGTSKPNLVSNSIKFSGYDNVYVDANKPYIYLENPDMNDVYFTYTIYSTDDDSLIMEETGLIEPGKSYPWEASEYLDAGEHTVYFTVKTYKMDKEQTLCTQVNIKDVHVTVY